MSKINFTVKKLESLKPKAVRVDYWDDCLPGFILRVNPGGEKTFCVL